MTTSTGRLVRTSRDRWLGGVCGGIARRAGVDANHVRLAVAVLTVLGFGTVVVAYVLAWMLMPLDG